MNTRMSAVLLALAAVALYFGVALPMQARAGAAADAFGAARLERQEATTRLAELQRRGQARARAMAAVKGSAADAAATTRTVRRSVALAVDGSRASGVQLTIRPSANGVDVDVTARGSAADVVDLSGRLARPEHGVILERVAFARAGALVTLQVNGLGIAR